MHMLAATSNPELGILALVRRHAEPPRRENGVPSGDGDGAQELAVVAVDADYLGKKHKEPVSAGSESANRPWRAQTQLPNDDALIGQADEQRPGVRKRADARKVLKGGRTTRRRDGQMPGR